MKSVRKKILLYLFLFGLPILAAFITYSKFQKTYVSRIQAFNSQTGSVAGEKRSVNDAFLLPDNIPIMDNSQVLNFDSSDATTSITYETTATEKQIKNFYNNFIDENGFIKISDGLYGKGNKELNIKISENIVVINYYEK